MHLQWLESRFLRRIDLAERRLGAYLQQVAGLPTRGAQLHELEGWLSEVWQTWCRFCRRAVVESCLGSVTCSGVILQPTYASEGHVSFVASKQKRGVAPRALGVNTVLRLEPTWGHVDKLLEVIQALAPPNAVGLSSAFGTVPSIEHVRLIRNSTAHMNTQTMAEVMTVQPQYVAFPVRHPLQALFWQDSVAGKPLIHARLDDMRVAAMNACL